MDSGLDDIERVLLQVLLPVFFGYKSRLSYIGPKKLARTGASLNFSVPASGRKIHGKLALMTAPIRRLVLRVQFSFKTDCGYPKNARITGVRQAAASSGALAAQPPRATRSQPQSTQIWSFWFQIFELIML